MGRSLPFFVNAIVSIEDRRFFDDTTSIMCRLIEGVLDAHLAASPNAGWLHALTMQMARAFFLTNERSPSRKLAEMTIALVLEPQVHERSRF